MQPSQTELRITMDTVAAGTDATRYHTSRLPGKWYIVEAWLEPDVDVADDATNVTDISFNNGATELASHDTTTGEDGAITGGTPIDFTPAEGSARVVADGDQLKLIKTDGGSGKAFSGSLVVLLEHRPIP